MLSGHICKTILRPVLQSNARFLTCYASPVSLRSTQYRPILTKHICIRIPSHANVITSFETKIRSCSNSTEPSADSEPQTKLASTVGGGGANKDDRDPRMRDPTKVVTVETSMRYLKSEAYKETYGDNRVWVLYRRNFKGQFAPKKTRLTCMRGGKLSTGNPCPICRDEYLVLDYRNVDLLKQFISPHNGEILGYDKTCLCQKQHLQLLAAIEKAKDYGTISFDQKFRVYDYEEYYPKDVLETLKKHGHYY